MSFSFVAYRSTPGSASLAGAGVDDGAAASASDEVGEDGVPGVAGDTLSGASVCEEFAEEALGGVAVEVDVLHSSSWGGGITVPL
jgi:hypothetical protein